MPAMDGTGPLGYGPMTGRGAGPCGQQGQRRGFFGRGNGSGGRRCGCPFFWGNAPSSPEEQEQFLEEELKAIRAERAASDKQKK